MNNIIDLFDRLVDEYNIPEFIINDPVQFPRRFSLLQDIEISAFLVSMITWGRRNMILRNAEQMLFEMNYAPFDYIKNGIFRKGKESLHRTFKWDDFADICISLQAYYQENDSLETLFSDQSGGLDLAKYKKVIKNQRVPDWNKGSASKRLHMFLRWMVRNDRIVDIGCWKNISPSALYIPLDTHVMQNARKMGLLERKSNDRKAVEQLTLELIKFCPEDPVKYDFALFGAAVGI